MMVRHVSLWLALAGSLLAGSVPVHATQAVQASVPPLTGHVRIMIAGDSTASGYPIRCADGTTYGERQVLGDWLVRDAGRDVGFVGSQASSCAAPYNRHEGRPGETIFHLADTIGGYLAANPADVLILRVGVNDATSWSNWHSAETMAADYIRLVDNARAAHPGIRILASQIIPPNGSANVDLSRASVTARRFNAMLPGILAPYGDAVHIGQFGKITPVWLVDNLHPTGQGYVGIAWILIEQPDGMWPWLSADPPPALQPWDVVLDPWR